MKQFKPISPETGAAAAGSRKGHHGGIMILICGILAAGFLLLLVYGVKSYRSSVFFQEKDASVRAQLSAISTIVRSGDAKGQIAVTEGKYGPMLEITENEYTVRIYRNEGLLLQEYGPKGAQADPSRAEEIGKTEVFTVKQEGSLLTIRTDEGQVKLNVRSIKD